MASGQPRRPRMPAVPRRAGSGATSAPVPCGRPRAGPPWSRRAGRRDGCAAPLPPSGLASAPTSADASGGKARRSAWARASGLGTTRAGVSPPGPPRPGGATFSAITAISTRGYGPCEPAGSPAHVRDCARGPPPPPSGPAASQRRGAVPSGPSQFEDAAAEFAVIAEIRPRRHPAGRSPVPGGREPAGHGAPRSAGLSSQSFGRRPGPSRPPSSGRHQPASSSSASAAA